MPGVRGLPVQSLLNKTQGTGTGPSPAPEECSLPPDQEDPCCWNCGAMKGKLVSV